MRILIALLLGIALVIVLGVAFIYSGFYNIAALTPLRV